jgi:hypothetical protein
MNEDRTAFTPDFLRAVVDALLPGLPATVEGAAALPAASQLGIDRLLADHLTTHPNSAQFAQALQAIIHQASSMADFAAADEATATEILQKVERAENTAFLALVFIVSADYYETEDVLRAFGWRDSPPQPLGYRLPPFDEELLMPVKRKQKLWRSADEQH